MRLIFITLLALILATVVGLGSTWLTATRGTEIGTLTIGAWTARPKNGTAEVDPYSRASIARSGELPIGTGDGVAFSATTDDKKKPLDGRCDVVVSGVTPAARFWTLTLLRPQGTSGRQFAAALRLHQPGNHPRLRRRVRNPRRLAFARRQLAADRRHRTLRADAAAVRYAGRRCDADPARCADALDLHGELPMIRLVVHHHRGRAAGRRRASRQRAGAAAHRQPGRLFAPDADHQAERGDAAAARRPEQRDDAVHGPGVRDGDLPLRPQDGPIKLTVPVSQAYTSVSFYTRNEVAYYAINDRSAGRKVIELDLMTEAQHNELPEDEDVTAADRLIIDFADRDRPDRAEGAGAGARPDAAGAGLARRLELQGAD